MTSAFSCSGEGEIVATPRCVSVPANGDGLELPSSMLQDQHDVRLLPKSKLQG